MADYLVQMRKNGEYVPSEWTMVHVREVLNLMSRVTNDSRFRYAADEIEKGDEPKNMCTVLDKVESRGRQIGITEGRKEGRREGHLEAAELMNFLWSNGRAGETTLKKRLLTKIISISFSKNMLTAKQLIIAMKALEKRSREVPK